MESNRFDMLTRHLSLAGTRRRAIASLAAASLGLGLMQIENADAKKKRKHKRKRCKKLGQTCNPGGKRKCCGDLSCEVREGNTSADCCVGLGGTCDSAQDCCEGACLPDLIGGGPNRCTVLCVPDCTGKNCGDDSCGGSCGTCTLPLICHSNGTCGPIV